MGQRYYSDLFHTRGGQLEVHFFEPDVLDRYRQHPDYNFYGSRFCTKEFTDRQIEPSAIQQFMWAQKADGSPCVAGLRSHLITLSTRDQLLWRSRELNDTESEHAKICSRYKGPMLYGAWPDTMSRFAAVYLYLKEISKLFVPDLIFPALPGRHPDFLAPLSYGTRRAFLRFTQDLYSILDVKPSILACRIKSSKKKALLDRKQTWNLLELYFEEHGLLTIQLREGIELFRELNGWRRESAHTIQPAVEDDDYQERQADLVWRLQVGLKLMLLAFAKIEKGSDASISSRVLNLHVE